MFFYLSIFVCTIFLILFGSLAASHLSRRRFRRRERASALAQVTEPPPLLPPDMRVPTTAAVRGVVAAEHAAGRHREYFVVGCAGCELEARRRDPEADEVDDDDRIRARVSRGGDIEISVPLRRD